MTSQTTYIVQTFAGAGSHVPAAEIEVASLGEARAEARRRLGVSRLTDARKGGLPDEEGLIAVECWCEMTERQARGRLIGGVAIYRRIEA